MRPVPIHGRLSYLFDHASAYGFIGVDLFFVLSGYLITNILIASRGSEHFYRNFYARRALRIFPVYYLAVTAALVIAPAIGYKVSTGLWGPYPWTVQVWYWLNLSNLVSAFNPFLVPPLLHFWSLAIEEQFYLFWPALVSRISKGKLIWVLSSCILAEEIGRNLPFVTGLTARYPDFTYRLTPLHADGLLFGALLAILLRSRIASFKHLRLTLSVTCVVVILSVATIRHLSGAPAWQVFLVRWSYLCSAIFFAALIGLLLVSESRFWLSRLFALPALRIVGTLSYCLYVTHIAGLQLGATLADRLTGVSADMRAILTAPIAFLLCLVVAAISRAVIEVPALRLKRYFPSNPTENAA